MTTPDGHDFHPQRSWLGFKGKTLWDWLSLLVVPAVLALGAILIEERFREQQAEIETTRMRASVMEEFVDRIAELVIDANLKGEQQDPNVIAVKTVAQARTNFALQQLDLVGKLHLVYFLLDIGLVQQGPGCQIRGFEERKARVISLAGVDLATDPGSNGRYESHEDRYLGRSDDKWAELSRKCLNGVDLKESNLQGAHLSQWMPNANLFKANLQGASLRYSDLSGGFLRLTDLRGADLGDANLSNADLIGADLSAVNIADADVDGAQFFVLDPEVATPHNPADFIDFETGKNSGTIVNGVDFSKVKNISEEQGLYLCRNGAIGLECTAHAP